MGGTPSKVWGTPGLVGYPIPGLDGGVPHSRSEQWGSPSQVWMGDTPSQVWMGVPHPRSGLGVPHPRSGGPHLRSGGGEVPHPRSRWGVPHPRSGGTPGLVGYPIPGLDGVYPIPGQNGGVSHSRSGWGYPILGLDRGYPSQVWIGGYPGYPPPWLDGVPPIQTWDGYPPVQTWDGVPPRPGMWYPPIINGWGTPPTPSIASICYTAGGMPFAFMQGDFPFFSVISSKMCLCYYDWLVVAIDNISTTDYSYWWLGRGTLLMELVLLRDFF